MAGRQTSTCSWRETSWMVDRAELGTGDTAFCGILFALHYYPLHPIFSSRTWAMGSGREDIGADVDGRTMDDQKTSNACPSTTFYLHFPFTFYRCIYLSFYRFSAFQFSSFGTFGRTLSAYLPSAEDDVRRQQSRHFLPWHRHGDGGSRVRR